MLFKKLTFIFSLFITASKQPKTNSVFPRNFSTEKVTMDTFKQWISVTGKELYPHQVSGMEWIIQREKTSNGGVIADEMGLGKTTLALGTILSNFLSKTLVVVPTSLLFQWFATIKKDLGHTPYVYHASIKNGIRQLKDAPLVLTTYGMMGISEKVLEQFESGERKNLSPLHDQIWDRIIYDEAHNLKNRRTSRFRGAKLLKTKYQWFYSGTPIQIHASDARALVELLGFTDVKKTDAIIRTLNEVMLQRTREDLGMEMPKVNIHKIMVPFKETEGDDAIVFHADDELPFEQTDCPICMEPYAEGDKLVKLNCGHVFHATCARQAHHHAEANGHSHQCATCRSGYDPSELETGATSVEDVMYRKFRDFYKKMKDGEGEYEDLLSRMSAESHLVPLIRMRQIVTLPKSMSASIEAHVTASADADESEVNRFRELTKADSKVAHIADKLDELGPDQKTILFTHFRIEVDTYTKLLAEKGYSVAFIDSRVPLDLRKKILDEDAPFQVIVIQMRTSCDGLNLRHIRNIMFTSPSFNHGATKQAIARANRIDSEHDVNVFFLAFTGTFEETLLGKYEEYLDTFHTPGELPVISE